MPAETLTCRDCMHLFQFDEGEQKYYALHGLHKPSRCKGCRALRKSPPPLQPAPIGDAPILTSRDANGQLVKKRIEWVNSQPRGKRSRYRDDY